MYLCVYVCANTLVSFLKVLRCMYVYASIALVDKRKVCLNHISLFVVYYCSSYLLSLLFTYPYFFPILSYPLPPFLPPFPPYSLPPLPQY